MLEIKKLKIIFTVGGFILDNIKNMQNSSVVINIDSESRPVNVPVRLEKHSHHSESDVSMCSCIMLIIGFGLIGGATTKSCGLTLSKSKFITEERFGTVVNSSVVSTLNTNDTVYTFLNEIKLNPKTYRIDDLRFVQYCSLEVYSGSNYSVGQQKLLPINQTVEIFFIPNSYTCEPKPKLLHCKTEYDMTLSGIVLATFGTTVFFCWLFSCSCLTTKKY